MRLLISTFLALTVAAAAATAQSPKAPAPAPKTINAADFPSLQAAFDALPAAGGIVRIPPGEYVIDQPLVLKVGDVKIEGSGTATHIKNTNTAGLPALVIHADGLDHKPAARPKLWRVMLSDFRLTGNEKSGHGIVANVNEIFLQGLTVSEHGGHGIFLDHCYEDPRVNDCLITYNKQSGLHLVGCHDIVVSGNQFEENLDALRCHDGFNLCMTGNNLDDHVRHGVVIENTYGSVVSGNMIEECQGNGIVLDRDCYGITLSSNVIAHEFAGGIDLIDAHGCTVSANTFTIVKKFALAIRPGSGRITVTGNNFSDSYIGGKSKRQSEPTKSDQNPNAAGGIVLDGATDIVITGNLFSGLRETPALSVPAPSRRILFTNNIVTDTGFDATNLTDSLIKDNLGAK